MCIRDSGYRSCVAIVADAQAATRQVDRDLAIAIQATARHQHRDRRAGTTTAGLGLFLLHI